MVQSLYAGSRNGVDEAQCLYFISEKLYPHRFVGTSQKHIYGIAPHPECSPLEIGFSA